MAGTVAGLHFSGNQKSAICKCLEGDRGKLVVVMGLLSPGVYYIHI